METKCSPKSLRAKRQDVFDCVEYATKDEGTRYGWRLKKPFEQCRPRSPYAVQPGFEGKTKCKSVKRKGKEPKWKWVPASGYAKTKPTTTRKPTAYTNWIKDQWETEKANAVANNESKPIFKEFLKIQGPKWTSLKGKQERLDYENAIPYPDEYPVKKRYKYLGVPYVEKPKRVLSDATKAKMKQARAERKEIRDHLKAVQPTLTGDVLKQEVEQVYYEKHPDMKRRKKVM